MFKSANSIFFYSVTAQLRVERAELFQEQAASSEAGMEQRMPSVLPLPGLPAIPLQQPDGQQQGCRGHQVQLQFEATSLCSYML